MNRPARPLEAQILSVACFAGILIAGLALHKAMLPVLAVATLVWLGVRIAGLWLVAEYRPVDLIEDEKQAA